MSFYLDTGIKLTFRGRPFACPNCKADAFTVRHIHNPYGSDMCEDVARCDSCKSEYRQYVGVFDEAVQPPRKEKHHD